MSRNKLPLLPVRDIVVLPHMVISLLVGRDRSIRALDKANSTNKKLFICTQKNYRIKKPKRKDLYPTGVVAEVLQSIELPEGTYKILIEAKNRAKIKELKRLKTRDDVEILTLKESISTTVEAEALMRTATSQFEEYVKLNSKIPEESILSINAITDISEVSDAIAAQIDIKVPKKQEILNEVNPLKRIKKLNEILASEIKILKVERKILGDVKRQMEKTQKDYYLQQQLEAIEKELGYKKAEKNEHRKLKKKIEKSNMSREAHRVALEELNRLKRMNPVSPESAVVRNYIDWLIKLPWAYKTKDKLDISEAKKILNEDHYGLNEAKQRILEYLAVKKLSNNLRSQILCFVGPPGVGKTSLAKSIARALGRKFVRVSLGGVKDEAEIKGHRRTYVGALPGRIIQSISKAGSKNPVFLLDEVDKMSSDFRGDPASSMLEVLDPEENHTFNDHYLGVEFDLSSVLFITTSNIEYNIPHPLRDRMEIIKLPGYAQYEKLNIAKKFLLPKQIKRHGLLKENLTISNKALDKTIKGYTQEAGVRNLERELASICRKIAKDVVEKRKKNFFAKVTLKNLHKFLGPVKYAEDKRQKQNLVGLSYGLAWTEAGGKIMPVETTVIKGKGKLILTGKLGEVMRESAQAALTFIRSRADQLEIKPNFYKDYDIHIHVPEGAIPKDGPSAGITIATSIASSLANLTVDKSIAMTGEITLRGRVLQVGGIKSKILAAHRGDFKTIIIPKENKKDLSKIPNKVLKKLNIKLVENADKVLNIALKKQQKKRKKHEKHSRKYSKSVYQRQRIPA
jgi:ATP-dependent Lon protease